MSIGERISDLRKQRNLSQAQLAQALGISRQAVCKWENDQTSPDTLNLIRLADVLDTQVEYIATGNLLPKPPAPPAPIVVNLVKKVDKVVEVEKIIEKPVVKRLVRTRYIRNPVEYILTAIAGFGIGLLIAFLL